MMNLNKAALTAYKNRWAAVSKIEQDELRQSSIAERWRTLNALVRMADGLNLSRLEDEVQISAVRNRWALLRERYLINQQRRAA
jgi:hypothetical protein